MDSFDSYVIRKLYKETAKHGDKLGKIEKHVDWNVFRPIIHDAHGRQNMKWIHYYEKRHWFLLVKTGLESILRLLRAFIIPGSRDIQD